MASDMVECDENEAPGSPVFEDYSARRREKKRARLEQTAMSHAEVVSVASCSVPITPGDDDRCLFSCQPSTSDVADLYHRIDLLGAPLDVCSLSACRLAETASQSDAEETRILFGSRWSSAAVAVRPSTIFSVVRQRLRHVRRALESRKRPARCDAALLLDVHKFCRFIYGCARFVSANRRPFRNWASRRSERQASVRIAVELRELLLEATSPAKALSLEKSATQTCERDGLMHSLLELWWLALEVSVVGQSELADADGQPLVVDLSGGRLACGAAPGRLLLLVFSQLIHLYSECRELCVCLKNFWLATHRLQTLFAAETSTVWSLLRVISDVGQVPSTLAENDIASDVFYVPSVDLPESPLERFQLAWDVVDCLCFLHDGAEEAVSGLLLHLLKRLCVVPWRCRLTADRTQWDWRLRRCVAQAIRYFAVAPRAIPSAALLSLWSSLSAGEFLDAVAGLPVCCFDTLHQDAANSTTFDCLILLCSRLFLSGDFGSALRVRINLELTRSRIASYSRLAFERLLALILVAAKVDQIGSDLAHVLLESVVDDDNVALHGPWQRSVVALWKARPDLQTLITARIAARIDGLCVRLIQRPLECSELERSLLIDLLDALRRETAQFKASTMERVLGVLPSTLQLASGVADRQLAESVALLGAALCDRCAAADECDPLVDAVARRLLRMTDAAWSNSTFGVDGAAELAAAVVALAGRLGGGGGATDRFARILQSTSIADWSATATGRFLSRALSSDELAACLANDLVNRCFGLWFRSLLSRHFDNGSLTVVGHQLTATEHFRRFFATTQLNRLHRNDVKTLTARQFCRFILRLLETAGGAELEACFEVWFGAILCLCDSAADNDHVDLAWAYTVLGDMLRYDARLMYLDGKSSLCTRLRPHMRVHHNALKYLADEQHCLFASALDGALSVYSGSEAPRDRFLRGFIGDMLLIGLSKLSASDSRLMQLLTAPSDDCQRRVSPRELFQQFILPSLHRHPVAEQRRALDLYLQAWPDEQTDWSDVIRCALSSGDYHVFEYAFNIMESLSLAVDGKTVERFDILIASLDELLTESATSSAAISNGLQFLRAASDHWPCRRDQAKAAASRLLTKVDHISGGGCNTHSWKRYADLFSS